MSSIASSKPDTGAHIIDRIANEIECKSSQVNSAIELLDGGATVPFISRYRKEVTGGLSDSQLRTLEDRLSYLRELESRRASIIENIDSLGKLDSTLLKSLQSADTKSELEDLYLPYKQKRKTKGVMAIEAGLEPLAEQLWSDPSQTPIDIAESYVDSEKGVADAKAALTGAKYILMERYAEDAALIAKLRDLLTGTAYLCSSVFEGKEKEGEKFRDYFDYQEQLSKVPSHRALAMFRGRAEGILALSLKVQESTGEFSVQRCFDVIAAHTHFSHNAQPGDDWKKEVVEWTWKIKLATHLESGLFTDLRDKADAEAIRVFADNLKDLLLAAPAGARATLGLDPGFRSGVKVAVVDTTGKLVDHTTIYPHQPQKQWDKAVAEICALCEKHKVQLLAIGNGTASRETDQFASEVIKRCKNKGLLKITVSEAGASVYSASETAEKEFPQLDVTIRGAVSIARRLQDPLAELVKIDPKAIGVGQYQHDVSQLALARSLDATVEDCVNSVGVDLNTCSAALLTRVAGISASIANNIVEHRDQNGAFQQRDELTTVSRLGPKAYEQCAAFLKITDGKNPLDQSAVHPEAYPVVEAIVQHCGVTLTELIGDSQRLRQLDAKAFTNDKFGLPTVRDIIIELDKPGRDPRPEFKTASFAANIEKISDLQPDQVLEGQVTNVTNFGAFVDVGVHQDGLVHIASMSNKFIKDPREVVKTGDIVKVKVMSVDVERKRISLSMRLDDSASEQLENSRQPAQSGNNQRHSANNRHGGGSNQSSNRNSAGRAPGRPSRNSSGKSAARTSGGSSNNTAVPSALALALQASLGDKGLEK